MKNTYEGKWVIDTNILVYVLDLHSSHQRAAADLFHKIYRESIDAVVGQQNIIEAERVLVQVYKRLPEEAIEAVSGLVTDYHLSIITPIGTTYQRFHKILHSVPHAKTVDFFDYYLAATMLDNGITNIFTANTQDFSTIPGIRAVNPFLPSRPRV
ncbi:type II toxin-antitoxin system VapC family toxin [Candidatus Gottesmanbacteria bacterium]|nr:type II toxin-antitoxin system VapC family toxin [Candidatus Gottesmanbacteria bacterium]